jgi:holo-[acyl-carrier protein] synthase
MPMAWHGLGVDFEDVGRFQSLLRNKRFLARVFTADELAYCRQKKNQAQHLAVRVAAKEAVWKALSERLAREGRALGHRDISVRNDASGKPHVVLPRPLQKWSKRILLSLSHTKTHAVAVAAVSGS